MMVRGLFGERSGAELRDEGKKVFWNHLRLIIVAPTLASATDKHECYYSRRVLNYYLAHVGAMSRKPPENLNEALSTLQI